MKFKNSVEALEEDPQERHEGTFQSNNCVLYFHWGFGCNNVYIKTSWAIHLKLALLFRHTTIKIYMPIVVSSIKTIYYALVYNLSADIYTFGEIGTCICILKIEHPECSNNSSNLIRQTIRNYVLPVSLHYTAVPFRVMPQSGISVLCLWTRYNRGSKSMGSDVALP